jgi:dATP pyrophosphohydrolase
MKIESCLVEINIIRKSDSAIEFLLMKRSEDEKYPGVWQMVTGHIEENEKAKDAAVRETFEETGLRLENLWSIPHLNSFYNPETDSICFIPVFVSKVEHTFVPKLSEEHSEYLWATKEEAVKLVAWPGQRKSIEIIAEYFTEERSEINFLRII